MIEVLNMIQNFKPEFSVLKKRIESLIERDYMMRDENDDSLLIYKP
jgi:hypothetical protein